MPLVHDAECCEAIRTRLRKLTPEAPRQWGRMSVDQMLWHLSAACENALGRRSATPVKMPLPRPILRFAALHMPWPRGRAPTARELVAKGAYDFESERSRTLQLLDEIAGRQLEGTWPESAAFGRMSGRDWSRLMAKHFDHHLRQFGA